MRICTRALLVHAAVSPLPFLQCIVGDRRACCLFCGGTAQPGADIASASRPDCGRLADACSTVASVVHVHSSAAGRAGLWHGHERDYCDEGADCSRGDEPLPEAVGCSRRSSEASGGH